jgi:site-specific recombinase XerD
MDNPSAVEQFERHLQRRYPERSTAKHYLSDLRVFHAGCPKPWKAVTPTDIDTFVDYGRAQGWKPATLARRVAALKAFFEFCAVETEGWEQPNPVQPRRHTPKREHRLPRDLSDEVVERLWLAIDQPRDQVWFTLMLRGGLRVGEVVALNRGDVLTPATTTQPARLRVLGKGRKERIIYLSTDGYAVVARWQRLLPGGLETPLCPNARGKRMSVNGVQERLRHYAERAGVSVTCHQLRHTFARQLVEHDMPVAPLSKLLGHNCLSTTQVYLTVADPQVREAYLTSMADWEEARPMPPAPLTPFETVSRLASPASPAPPRALPNLAENWAPHLPVWVRAACLGYVRQLAYNWKVSQQRRHSKRRLDLLAQFWRWQLGRRPIQAWTELTRADLRAFVDEWVGQGRAPSTIKNILSPLWGILRQLRQQGEAIPDSVFRVELPKDRQTTPRHLSETEAAQLERHMHAHLVHDTPEARRDAAWYFVLAHTGIRLNELVDLQRGDLDLPGGRLRIDQGKGRRDRIVYLSETAQAAVARYLTLLPAYAPEAPLFYRVGGEPLAYRWVEYRLRQLGDEAGVGHVTPHRLRHTFATRLINRGVAITTLQKLLGHSDLNTTQRYATVADQTVEREYREAMHVLEHKTGALNLAPVPLEAIFATVAHRITQPLDNSM